ncbi:MAG: c-type cytochrome [Nannocystaceae bacterium]|nr:c-type cytochrome [Nannocystaceae bacterium]
MRLSRDSISPVVLLGTLAQGLLLTSSCAPSSTAGDVADSSTVTGSSSSSDEGSASDTVMNSSGSGESTADGASSDDGGMPPAMTAIPQEPWRVGNAELGRNVLLYGNNTGGGIPIELYVELPGPPVENVFDREGVSADVPWFYNAYETPNGVTVAAPSCLSCHASRFSAMGDTVVIGLGNVFLGGRLPTMGEISIVSLQVETRYGEDSPEVEAFQPFFDGVVALIGHAEPPFPGTNAAFMVEEAAIAHRDPTTQAWLQRPRFAKTTDVLASDVPPWWHLKKKNALYYNGMGRGDAARLLMQSSVLASFGLEHMLDVDASMPDLLAYLLTIEAPVFPDAVDDALVSQGAALFEATCEVCHGTYGAQDDYPNLLVSLSTVGTDPVYAEYFMQPDRLVDAYNDGWFSTGDPGSRMQPEAGYVAPPLDGVWASAPYFHNGSVPTLDAVLDSESRPTTWLRDFETKGYELAVPGLQYEEVSPGTPDAYDTERAGYGNGGHTFGDAFSQDERAAVVEYLKTL